MSEEELIETLRAFEKNRVEQLEEPARNLFYAIMKIADERDRLNNIINEIEKDIENKITFCSNEANGSINNKLCKISIQYLEHLKNRLQELKGSDKE